jgi:anhydro-N-acetylmuramic acid kinase
VLTEHQDFVVIGLMSGTSLDGLDIVCCSFTQETNSQNFTYKVHASATRPYDDNLATRLQHSKTLSGVELAALNRDFSAFCAHQVNQIRSQLSIKTSLLASHGHTVFHQPHNGFTLQIGNGAQLAALTGMDVVCDFRSTDVALGGQGAPLVPMGDALLFPEYPICLNLGGIANISGKRNSQPVACDITFCNMALNAISRRQDLDFDSDGHLASQGNLIPELLLKLNNLDFVHQALPRSTGSEWFEREVVPLLSEIYRNQDLLHTLCEHVAVQIAKVSDILDGSDMLVTGGGAWNSFLIDRISHHARANVIVPDDETVAFKEAIVFAFLGFLRYNQLPNCLRSITGASMDSCSGALYKAP